MLTLTPTAAEAVGRLVDSAPAETAEGLRIALDDEVLDAELEETGVRFSIRDQESCDTGSNGHS